MMGGTPLASSGPMSSEGEKSFLKLTKGSHEGDLQSRRDVPRRV